MGKLQGKVAVITGGSSGIGLATATRFVAEGAYVFITGRRQTELEKAKEIIGSNVTAVQGDIASLDDLNRLYETVQREKGGLDIIVASAGYVASLPTESVTPEHFDKTFDINARGTFFTVQKALPLMRDGGSIVVVASGMHIKGFADFGVYAAKAAIRSFTRTWASEFKGRGIRVNTLSPGMIETPIVDGLFNSKEEADGARAMEG
ncbi:SDR family NAD(P)-dependent oxidoreductase [Paraburkholderia caribensis]|uniref:SDR family NAD(P)-dependent oxidoreductase n=1 Tax=Paraburkholderia caribensis TaxID=75105 RepID=UPI0034D2EF13